MNFLKKGAQKPFNQTKNTENTTKTRIKCSNTINSQGTNH